MSTAELRDKIARNRKSTPERTVSEILPSAPPSEDTRRITLRLPTADVKALKRASTDDDTTMNAIVSELVRNYLEGRDA